MKFDSCKAFGVEEGQEFRIFKKGRRCDSFTYKIQNGILMYGKDFAQESSLEFNDLVDYEIEIVQPQKSIPENIKKILEKCKKMGCFTFNFDTPMWKAEGSYVIIKFNYEHALYAWAQKNISKYPIYRIDDILSGNF